MKIYVASLLAGLLVGAVYALINVRSPAPPTIALVGLFGMLLGEQGFSLGKRLVQGQALTSALLAEECVPKVTGIPAGAPPSASPPEAAAVPPSSSASEHERE
jgi:XapX domain-containing protein